MIALIGFTYVCSGKFLKIGYYLYGTRIEITISFS